MRGNWRQWTPQGASHSVTDSPRVGRRKVGCWHMCRAHAPAAIQLTTIHTDRPERCGARGAECTAKRSREEACGAKAHEG